MKLPRFSLRLLLVAVAVLCAWLAWERSVVQERQAVLTKRRAWGVPASSSRARIPLHRVWFGDRAMDQLWVPANSSRSEVQRLSRLFPEARILDGPPGGGVKMLRRTPGSAYP